MVWRLLIFVWLWLRWLVRFVRKLVVRCVNIWVCLLLLLVVLCRLSLKFLLLRLRLFVLLVIMRRRSLRCGCVPLCLTLVLNGRRRMILRWRVKWWVIRLMVLVVIVFTRRLRTVVIIVVFLVLLFTVGVICVWPLWVRLRIRLGGRVIGVLRRLRRLVRIRLVGVWIRWGSCGRVILRGVLRGRRLIRCVRGPFLLI